MKRKLALVFLAVVMVMAAAFGLAACGDNPVQNSEFEEYEKIVITVIENTVGKLGERTQTGKHTVASAKALVSRSFSAEEKDDLFAYLNGFKDKEPTDNSSFYRDVFEQTFYLPLIGGDIIREYHSASNFYGVTICAPFWGQYFKTVSEGTRKITYALTDGPQTNNAYICMEIDFKSESDFAFRVLQMDKTGTETLFLYGNDDLQFLAISHGGAEGSDYVLFDNPNGTGFRVLDNETIKYCHETVAEQFSLVDRAALDGMKDEESYTVTEDEWNAVNLKYFPDSGMTVDEGPEWVIENGIVSAYGWDDKNVTELTLPSEAEAVFFQLHIPQTVKKLTFPANIKSIKIPKDELEYLETGVEPEDPDLQPGEQEPPTVYVDCPAKYFQIMFNGGEMGAIEEIVVEEGCKVFAVKNYCLYAKEDGTLLYVPANSAITELTLDVPVSEQAGYCLRNQEFSSLKKLTVTEEGLLAANWLLGLYSEYEVEKNISLDTLIVRAEEDSDDFIDGLELQIDYPVKEIFLYGKEDFRLVVGAQTEKVYIDLEGKVTVDTWSSSTVNGVQLRGTVEEVEISANTEAFDNSIACAVTVHMPYSVFYLKNSGKYVDLLPNDLHGITDFEATELKSVMWADGERIERTYLFPAMTDDEEQESELYSAFRNVYYYTAEESEYGIPYASIAGYWGTDSIVRVPESIGGYPVYAFELTTSDFSGSFGPPAVEGVAEIYLPGSLKKFSVWNAEEPKYSLKQIVYNGSKEMFLEIIGDSGFETLYSLLAFTDEIVCDDGSFTQQPDRESWMFADSDNNTLRIDIDWRDFVATYRIKAVQVTLTYGENIFQSHAFESYESVHFQFGDEDGGESKDAVYINFSVDKFSYGIDRMVVKDVQVSFGTGDQCEFVLKFTEEFTGTIEHDFSVSHTREPDCLAGGGTDWYCSVCGMFGYVTDEEPPLGHDSDEYGTCSRCGQNTYFDFDSYIDDYGQEAYALVRVKEDCKTAAELRVPEEVNSVPVRKINYGAFAGCYELERVYLPSTLVFYEADAFRDCSNLREVHIDNVAAWFGIAFENREASPLNTGAALYYGGGKITDLVIPDGVTKIGDYTLANCDLNSITIPESVVAIGDYAFQGNCSIRNATVTAFAAYKIPKSSLLAVTVTGGELTDGVFYDCPVLESVVLANGIQAISNYAFQNSAMLTSIDIPESVTSIGYEAFSGCAGLTQITLPSGLREIVSSLFYGCTGLEQVVIPEGVARIGQQAFYGCSGLTSITLPASVTAVDNMAFGGCDNLQKVCIDDLAAWCNIEFTDGESNPLFKAQYLYLKGEKAEYIEIPDGVEQIKQLAFFGYKNLRGVVIPDSVTEIDSSSFEDCSNLKSVETPAFAISYIPTSSLKTVAITSGEELPWGAFRAAAFLTSVSLSDSVTKIGREAFSGCSSLEAIELPGLLTDIEYCAFENCTSLVSVTIPNSVTQIDQYAFKGCSNLQSVSLPAIAAVCFTEHELLSVTITGGEKIPANAFQNCTSLETLVLKEGIGTIGSYAFAGCTSLERISIPASVTFMEAYVFNDCTGLKEVVFAAETRLEYGRGFEGCMNIESATCFADMMYYLPQDSLQTANIIGGSTISNDTFYNATHLREIHISDGIREIGARAFSGCVNLSSLEIPDSVTSIGEHAFSNCGVKELILSSAVESVGYACFADSIALESVIFEEGASISVLEKTLFMGCVNLRRLVLPQISDGIEPDALVDCTKLEELSVPFVGQNADGTGATNLGYLFGDETDNYSTVPSSLKKVCVSGSYPIPDEAFDSCRFIEEVILSTEIRQIGANAFAGCVSLAVISFGENSALQTIGVGAFTGCYDLVAVVIPSGVYQLGEAAFMNCRELKTVVFEANDLLQTIERMTFAGCSGLTGIAIPASVTQLGVSAFSGCSVLESINIPQGVTKLPDNVFAGCGFRTLTFGADCTITEIGEFAFMGCSRLESVRFSEGSKVRSIGKNAFFECDLLNTVELPEGLITLGENAFMQCLALKTVSFGEESALESLGMFAFYGCVSLVDICIPEKITEIANSTFYGCSALVSVEFSENLVKIGSHAFYMCKGLTNVVLPESLVAIEGMAFFGCSGLRQISIPESVTSIGSGAFQGSGLTDVVLGGSGTTIAANAFYVCTALQNVTFRDGTTSINGFSACNNLKNIIIPASVTAIADYAFTDSGLTIGDSVNIFYDGTSEQWNSVEIGTENDILDVAIVYYYSDTPPEDDGNYWHYAKDNVTPIIWVKGEGIYSV